MSDPDDVAALFAMMDERWGGVDALVNNAGIDGERAKIWEGKAADWKKVIDVNLMGTYFGIKEATTRMVPQGAGVILNISSVHEKIPWGGHTAYCAAKAGVGMMVQSLALELADSGVRVLNLAPGAIKTDINKDVWSDPKQLEDLKKKMPVNRMGTVEEVGEMAVMLLSDAASYLTGTTVYLDGGMTCYPSFAAGGMSARLIAGRRLLGFKRCQRRTRRARRSQSKAGADCLAFRDRRRFPTRNEQVLRQAVGVFHLRMPRTHCFGVVRVVNRFFDRQCHANSLTRRPFLHPPPSTSLMSDEPLAHRVRILKKEALSPTVDRWVTEKPAGYDFRPGQATHIAIDQKGLRDEDRAFTMTSLPEDDHLEFVIKRYPERDGMTDALSQVAVDEYFFIDEPGGKLTYDGPGTFIAGGAGVTPFIAILRAPGHRRPGAAAADLRQRLGRRGVHERHLRRHAGRPGHLLRGRRSAGLGPGRTHR